MRGCLLRTCRPRRFSSQSLGIAAGLFFGKQIGVFGSAALVIRAGWAHPLPGASWLAFYRTAVLTGIGFTMSLFIGGLAFDSEALQNHVKLGVFSGSLLAAVSGFLVLRFAGAR